jgi:hypothetical protein
MATDDPAAGDTHPLASRIAAWYVLVNAPGHH